MICGTDQKKSSYFSLALLQPSIQNSFVLAILFPSLKRDGGTENYFTMNPRFIPIPSIAIRLRLSVYGQVIVVCVIPSDLEFVILNVVIQGKVVIIDSIVGPAQT